MTVTVDGRELKVSSLTLRVIPVASEFDEMSESLFKHIIMPFGAYREWEIEAVEEVSVSWSNSIIKYLQDKAEQASEVSLNISENTYSFTGTVYIMDLTASFGEKTRIFRLVLREKEE
jgi:hypothetical protein